MQRVKFYTVNQKIVTAHGGYIPVYKYGPIVNCRNSSDIFLESEIKVDHLPVQRFCFTQDDGSIENRFVAFDRELEEVIDCLIDEGVANVSKQCSSYIQTIGELRCEIKTLQNRSIWSILFSNFKRKLK